MKYNTPSFTVRGIMCNLASCRQPLFAGIELLLIFQPGNLTCVCAGVCVCVARFRSADHSNVPWNKWGKLLIILIQPSVR